MVMVMVGVGVGLGIKLGWLLEANVMVPIKTGMQGCVCVCLCACVCVLVVEADSDLGSFVSSVTLWSWLPLITLKTEKKGFNK